MSNTRRFIRRAGVVASVTLLCAALPPLSAQVTRTRIDTTKKTTAKACVDTSAQRIPLQKEGVRTGVASGVLLIPTQDFKDSVERAALMREAHISADSILGAAMVTADSIAQAEQLRVFMERLREQRAARQMRIDAIACANEAAEAAALANKRATARGFYVGLAGGASLPQRNIRNGYTGGWNVTLPMGWDASSLPLGFRLDGAVDHLNGTMNETMQNVATATSGDLTIWSLNAGMKVRAHAPGISRTHLYAIGGVGAHWLTGGVYGTSGAKSGTNLALNDSKPRLGWNAGVGAAIAWGPSELFIESRFVQVKSDLDYLKNGGVGTYTSFTPIVVGLQWF